MAYCLRPIFRKGLPNEAMTLMNIEEHGNNWETFLNVSKTLILLLYLSVIKYLYTKTEIGDIFMCWYYIKRYCAIKNIVLLLKMKLY